MKSSELKRDPNLIQENFVEVDNRIITKQKCSLVIPYNYLQNKLARMGNAIYITSVAGVIIGDRYGALVACANINITPDETNQIKIDGEEFLEFVFEAGSAVMPSTMIVQDPDLAFEINKYFYTFGRVPWFLGYDDEGNVLKEHKAYSGLNISPTNTPFEIVTAKISRDPKNKFVLFRHSDMKGTPVVVPFSSVMFNATSTTAKILGNYLEDGVTSALLSPSNKTETVENLLRR